MMASSQSRRAILCYQLLIIAVLISLLAGGVTAREIMADIEEDSLFIAARNITQKQIDNLPVQTLGEILSLQNGLVSITRSSENWPEFHLRGSREYHNDYLLNGVSWKNPIIGRPTGLISPYSLGNIAVYSGSIPLKYKNANGGVIDMNTPRGATNSPE